MDRFGECSNLLNLQVTGHMLLEQYEEALPVAEKALELSPRDPTCLMNVITCSIHMNKKDAANILLEQLLTIESNHPGITFAKSFEEEFNSAKEKLIK